MTVTNGGDKPLTKKKRARKASRSNCSFPGCVKISQVGGVCCEHGARTSRSSCTFPGCSNSSQRGGLCRRHGSHRLRICTIEDCPKVGRYCGLHSGILMHTGDQTQTVAIIGTTAPIPLPAAAAAVAAATPIPPGKAETSSITATTLNVAFPPPSSLPPRPNPSSSGLKSTKSIVDKKSFYVNLVQASGIAVDVHDGGLGPLPPSVDFSLPPPDEHCQSVRSATRGLNHRFTTAQAAAQRHQASHTITVPQTSLDAIAAPTSTLGELVSALSEDARVAEERNSETYLHGNDEFDRSGSTGSIPEKRNTTWMIPAAIPATATTHHDQGYNTNTTARLVRLAIPSIRSDEINEQNFRTARILHAARMAIIRAATNKKLSNLTTTSHPPHGQADSPPLVAAATATGQLDTAVFQASSTTVPRCIPLFHL